MMKKKIALAGIAAFSLLMVGCSGGGSDAGGDSVTARVVLPLPSENAEMRGLIEDISAELEQTAPNVTIDIVGGPEVVPEMDQTEAVSNGAYDMTLVGTAYAEGFMPGISSAMLTPNTPTEEREAGTADLFNEIFFEPHNMTYLGIQQTNIRAELFLNDETCASFDPENPSLDGKVIRGGDQYVEAVEHLGGSIVSMPVGDIYNSLERGVIDGYGGTAIGVPSWGTAELTGCRISPSFKSIPFLLVVNNDWWNTVDEDTQQAIEEAIENSEGALEARYDEMNEEAYATLDEEGVKEIELSPEASEEFTNAIYDGAWERMISANPEVERLRDHWQG